MISYKKIFHGFIWFLFLSFMVVYVAQANGYYEDLNNKKSSLTKEKIKQFEKDVEEGKEIKVENYVVNVKKDYSNNISDFGLFTSKLFADGFKWFMTTVFENVDKMISE